MRNPNLLGHDFQLGHDIQVFRLQRGILLHTLGQIGQDASGILQGNLKFFRDIRVVQVLVLAHATKDCDFYITQTPIGLVRTQKTVVGVLTQEDRRQAGQTAGVQLSNGIGLRNIRTDLHKFPTTGLQIRRHRKCQHGIQLRQPILHRLLKGFQRGGLLSGTLNVQSQCGGSNRNALEVGAIRALVEKQRRTIPLGARGLNPVHPIRNLDLGLLGGSIGNLKLVLHSVFAIREQSDVRNFVRNGHSKEDLLKAIANRNTPVGLNPGNLPAHTSQPNRRWLFHGESLQLA